MGRESQKLPTFRQKTYKTAYFAHFSPKKLPTFYKNPEKWSLFKPVFFFFYLSKNGQNPLFLIRNTLFCPLFSQNYYKISLQKSEKWTLPKYFSPKPTFRNRNLARNHHHFAHFSNTIRDYLLNYLIYRHRYDEYI